MEGGSVRRGRRVLGVAGRTMETGRGVSMEEGVPAHLLELGRWKGAPRELEPRGRGGAMEAPCSCAEKGRSPRGACCRAPLVREKRWRGRRRQGIWLVAAVVFLGVGVQKCLHLLGEGCYL
jgi:hypothetical protein